MHNRPSVAVGAAERQVDIEAVDVARANRSGRSAASASTASATEGW